VVEVSVATPPRAFVPGRVIDEVKDVDNAGRNIKLIKAVGPGLTWNAEVTFNGPNGNRGVRQMRASFVQNLKVTRLTGSYNNNTLTSQMQGITYWDTRDNHEGSFYSSPGARPAAFFQNANQNLRTKIISEDDSPGWGPPMTRNGIQLTSMALVWDFQLYVVGATWDTRNGAKQVTAAQAETGWVFNGTGNTPGLNWQSAGAGVTPSGIWGLPADPMITVGPRFNSTFRNAGWI
jgi:hypothetical protein